MQLEEDIVRVNGWRTYNSVGFQRPQKPHGILYAFEIEGWHKGAFYMDQNWNVFAVSAVSKERYVYETSGVMEFLNGKKVTYLGEVIDECLGSDPNIETMRYSRELSAWNYGIKTTIAKK